MARDVVVIGASAGGIDALRQLVAGFPVEWKASVFVVVHLPANGESMLPAILQRVGPLPALHPEDGARVTPGTIAVAPPDHHLIVIDGHVRVLRGPRQNRYRPSADTLFRSAAFSYGPRVIGAVLTGGLDDGAAGLSAIHARGGVTIVQDPNEAKFSSMPRAALAMVDVDYCLPLLEIAPRMIRLSAESVPREVPVPTKEQEMEIRHDQGDLSVDLDSIGKPSYFTCPDCHGTLWEIKEGKLVRYRCRVGHGFTAESLIANMDDTLEDSLWEAARALVETAHLKDRVAERLDERDRVESAKRLRAQALVARRRAETIRNLLRSEKAPNAERTE